MKQLAPIRSARHALVVLLLAWPSFAQTTISLDGSLDPANVGSLGPTGPNLWEIPESLGARRGANLFHSFEEFSIGAGDTASFLPDPANPNPLSSVIARVTGGSPTSINGTLRSEIPGADFFLLNPSGLLFGGGATLDLPASFFASTAHQLEFAGTDAALDLVDASNPVLRSEPPSAFGFLGGTPAADIRIVNSPDNVNQLRLSVLEGETLAISGGAIRIEDRTSLRAPGGSIGVTAAGNASISVPLDPTSIAARAFEPGRLGEIVATDDTVLLASAGGRNPQGRVVIRGGRFELSAASTVRGGAEVTAVDIATSDSIEIAGDNTLVRAEAPDTQTAGELRLSSDTVTVSDGAVVRTLNLRTANAGDLVIDANAVRVRSRALVGTESRGSGEAGDVRIDTDLLELSSGEGGELEGGGEVQSLANSSGAGGDIVIDAREVEITHGTIATESPTGAPAGSITVRGGPVAILGADSAIQTSIQGGSPGPMGSTSGSITIDNESSLRLESGGSIATLTRGAPDAGSIQLRTGSLSVRGGGVRGDVAVPSAIVSTTESTGAAGLVEIDADELDVRGNANEALPIVGTLVAAGASGAGGSIDPVSGELRGVDIQVDALVVDGGAQISTSSRGTGDAGGIAITATQEVLLTGSQPLSSGVFAIAENDGNGGTIRMTAPTIRVEDGAAVGNEALGSGRSGDLSLRAADRIRITGFEDQLSTVSNRTTDGAGGNLELRADRIDVLDGASVDVSSRGAGDAGRLEVFGGELVIEGSGPSNDASMAAQADSTGSGGSILIDVERSVRVGPGGQITSLSRNLGAAGDIEIRSPELDVAGGRITAEAQANEVAGGDIDVLEASVVRITAGGEIAARSAGGNAGTVTIETGTFSLRDGTVRGDAAGFGGDVTIRGSERIEIEGGNIVAVSRGQTMTGPTGLVAQGAPPTPSGGNVVLEGGAIVLNAARIEADGFGNANGGNITISGDPYLASGDTRLTFSSELGVPGTLEVDAPDAEIAGELSSLPSAFLDASSQLAEACIARDAPSGSFSIRRIDGTTRAPDAPFDPYAALGDGPRGEQCEALGK